MAPIVEIAFESMPLDSDPVWTDVTDYVHMSTPIRITRGRLDELGQIQAGSCTLTLGNTDGRFSSGYPSGAYWPNVRKQRRLRVRVVHVVTNYVTNPGCELNAAGWDASVHATVARSTARFHSGVASCHILWGALGDATDYAYTDAFGLDIGSVYTLTAWVYVPAGSITVRVGIAGIGTSSTSTLVDTWELLTYTFTATSTGHRLRVTPTGDPGATDTLYVDDVQINAGASAVAYSSTGAYISPRFDGLINKWPTEWPGGGRESLAPITVTDIFKRLTLPEIRSLLEEEILGAFDPPLAYYTLAEDSASTSAGDDVGVGAGTLVSTPAGTGAGTLTFGSGAGAPATGLPGVTFAPDSSANGHYLLGDLGADFEAANIGSRLAFEGWFTTTTKGRVLLSAQSADGVYELVMMIQAASGLFRIETRAGAATASGTWATGDLTDGAPHHFAWNEVAHTLYIDGNSMGVNVVNTMYRMRYLRIGASVAGNLWAGTAAHVAAYVGTGLDSAYVTPHYEAGATGFAGEDSLDRVERLMGYVDLDPDFLTVQGSLFGQVASQGPGHASPLTMLQLVAEAEAAPLFAGRAGGLVLQSRDVRQAPVSAVTLPAADVEAGISYSDDEQYLLNEVRVTRPGGAGFTVSDQASRDEYGRRPRPVTLITATDDAARAAAYWILARFRDPEPRLAKIPVEGATLDTAIYRALLDLDISSTFTVTGLPEQAPASTDVVCVEGYAEMILGTQHLFEFNTSPSDQSQAWILDDAVYSILDSTTIAAY